jgi:cellulose synthase/poly-beta-1,6-N-acetylglucosamine synthase-like glycosyltransferase
MVVPALLFLITLALLFVYARQLGSYGRHVQPQPFYAPLSRDFPTVSVIIPARNEAANIGRCLTSLQKLDYPKEKLEIIVVDDQSEDDTAAIAASYPVTLIRSSPPPGTIAFKKAALAAGIASASGEIIFTTDADCTVQPKWLSVMVAALLQQEAMLVAGPVRMVPDSRFLSRFQALDYAILQGITAAAIQGRLHDMSSGANLAYYRKAFLDVDGFSGIDDIASGDDMLLMQKISGAYPGRVCYCFSRDAIVDTATENSWKLFLRQRIRWASKATRYRDRKLFRILLNVYLLNLCLFLMMCTSWMSIWQFGASLFLIAAKTAIEWSFVSKVLRFFSLGHLMPWFLPSQPLHILYTVISGLFGRAGSYAWKGRNVK